MGKLYCLNLIYSLLSCVLIFLILVVLVSAIIWYFAGVFNAQTLTGNFSPLTFIKVLLVVSLLVVSLTVFIATLLYAIFRQKFALYIMYSDLFSNLMVFDFFKLNVVNTLTLHFNVDGFGLVLLNLAVFVGLISLLSLDTRFYWTNVKFIFLCHFLIIAIYIFSLTNDIITFFLAYEALLIPSFLLVHYVSPYRKALQGSLYFVIWTQLGSFLVMGAVIYMINISGEIYFSHLKTYTFTINEIYILYALLFFGFGFKIPIWPFHHWLTKTHVEAPSGFSIFLSGFLVKSAVFGFYKLSNLLGGQIDTSFFSLFAFMGVLDSSFKMWAQTDLKKLVAYGTIQEMSLIYLVLSWGDSAATLGSIMFCITHAFLSALLFYLVDCIQRRYRTRSIVQLNGILIQNPNLALAILFTTIVYMGLPGTTKFITELYILAGLIESTPYTIVFLVFVLNYVGSIGFCKSWFNVVFGLANDKNLISQGDLSFKEVFIILFCFLNFFFFGQLFNLIMF